MKKRLSILTLMLLSVASISTWAQNVCKIGNTEYASLADAIAAVGDGGTITMIANETNAKGISVASNKNFTVDFAGHTYTVNKPGAGSLNTQTQAFQLLQNSTITFKNGKIECAVENKDLTWTTGATGVDKGIAMIIQNYANLTLEDMTIDGTNIAHNGKTCYIVSNNSGNVEFKGNTSILAPVAGDFAFDVYKYKTSSFDYPAPTVTWNSIGEVKGIVELSGGTFVLAKDFTANNQIIAAPTAEGIVSTLELGTSKINAAVGFSNSTGAVVLVRNGAELVVNGEDAGGITTGTYAYSALGVTKKGDSDLKAAKLTVNGGTFVGQCYGIVGNGTRQNTEVTINGGTIKAVGNEAKEWDGIGIYNPQNGKLIINGGTIEGAVGVYIKAGTTEVANNGEFNGGTIKGVGQKNDFIHSGSGVNSTGDALIVENCGYPGGKPSIIIHGGTFESKNANPVGSYSYGVGNEPLEKFISGGIFNKEPKAELIAEGFVAVKRADNFWTVEVSAQKVEEDLPQDIDPDAKTAVEELLKDTNIQKEVSELAEQNREANEEAVEDLEVDQTIQLQVVAKKAEVDEDDKEILTTLTFDVKPVYVTNGEVGEQVSNDKINAPIAFALPVGIDFSYAEVYHRGADVESGKGDYLGTLAVTNGAVLVKSKEFSEFDVKLTDLEEDNLDVYYGGDNESMTESKFFDEILPEYPNAIAFTLGDKAGKFFAEHHNNVVYEDENEDWICPNLVLTDISTLTEDQRETVNTDFYNDGYEFTAENLTYTRKGTKGLNSVYLPFAFAASDIDSEHASDIKIGVFEKVVPDYDLAVFKVEESLEPDLYGVACLIKDVRNLPNEEDYVWNIQKTNVEILTNDEWNQYQDKHNAGSVPCLNGSLVTNNSLELSGCNIWKIDDSGEFFGTANGGTCFPFRSYLVTSEESGTKLRIAWSDEATGISTIETIDNAKDGIMYNLLGVKVGNDYQGVVIKNGKTMLKK